MKRKHRVVVEVTMEKPCSDEEVRRWLFELINLNSPGKVAVRNFRRVVSALKHNDVDL